MKSEAIDNMDVVNRHLSILDKGRVRLSDLRLDITQEVAGLKSIFSSGKHTNLHEHGVLVARVISLHANLNNIKNSIANDVDTDYDPLTMEVIVARTISDIDRHCSFIKRCMEE